MLCDKCGKPIDEEKGYFTVNTSLDITFSHRVDGKLVNMLAVKPEITSERTCLGCAERMKVRAGK